MFAGKTGAYLSESLLGAPLYGRPLALPTNIRQGWQSLPGTNTLAYYENYGQKSFITLGPELGGDDERKLGIG